VRRRADPGADPADEEDDDGEGEQDEDQRRAAEPDEFLNKRVEALLGEGGGVEALGEIGEGGGDHRGSSPRTIRGGGGRSLFVILEAAGWGLGCEVNWL
jgi:hypothetical protein